MLINLFIISLLTRLVFLFFGHSSLTHDEADFYLQGYLLAKTGSEIHGNSLFSTSGILTVISPIPVYLNAFFFTFLPKTILTGRLPFAILNSLTPVFTYYIISKITSNKKLAFISFLVLNFSPWLSYLSSQAGYDSPLSFMFYLATISILLTQLKPKLKYFFFVLLSFISFNSYMGIKASFPFLIMVAFIFKSIYEKRPLNLKVISRHLLVGVGITAGFLFIVYLLPGNDAFKSRALDEVIFFNKTKLEHAVWYERYVIQIPEILKKIVSNKLTVIFDQFVDKYLKAFDPRIIFFRGDPHPLYGTYFFGLFYLFELILVFIGIFYAKKILADKAKTIIPFILLLLVSPIPTGISTIVDVTIVFRAYPLIFPMTFFISLGGYYLFNYLKSYFYIVSVSVYVLAFGLFFFTFQTKIKYFSSEQWHYSQKILSDRVGELKKKYDEVYVFTNEPKENALLYNYYQVEDEDLIKKSIVQATNRDFKVENVHIRERCPTEKLDEQNFYIIKREMCDVRKNKNKGFDYKLTPFIEAYDHSGTLYWQLTNLKSDK